MIAADEFRDLIHRVLASHPVVRVLRHALHQVQQPGFLVGGVVRDLWLYGQRADPRAFDMDLVVLGSPRPLVRTLEQQGFRVVKASPFGTFKLKGPKGSLDVAMARTETYPEPAALPKVQPAHSIEDDLARRDFTINSMALELWPEFGRHHDPFQGLRDLQEGWIRVLHEGSFRDDPTRAFRAVRYRLRFGFQYAPETVREFVHARAVMARLTFERIQSEILRIAQEPHPARCMQEVATLGLLEAYRPSWKAHPELLQRLSSVSLEPESEWPVLLVPFLFHHPGEVDRLPLKRSDRQMLRTLLQILQEPKPHDLAEAFDRYGHLPPRWLELASILTGWETLRRLGQRLREIRPCLRGDDLQNLGLQGRQVGQLLQEIRKQWVLGRIRSCEEEHRWVRQRLETGTPQNGGW